MKIGLKALLGSAMILGFMVCVVHADSGVAVTAAPVSTMQVPAWIVSCVKDLENIPAVGHIITFLLGIIAVGSAIITPLTGLLMAIEKALNLTGLLPAINFLNTKVIPALAYVSNFNAQVVTAPIQPAATVTSTPSTPSASS
jgi:hypothetical protein